MDELVLKKAIEVYGKESQIEMIEEECLELALAIKKLNRYKNSESSHLRIRDVIDEIADVKIMIAQAEIIFPKNLINERVNYKIQRLRNRLEKDGWLENLSK